MNGRHSSRVYLIGLLVLLLAILALISATSVSGGDLRQIDPTAQQQTVNAMVQTRLAQTAVTQRAIEATGQAETATAQMQAFEGMVNTQVAAAARATAQALLLAHVPDAVLHNTDWTPVASEIDGIEMVLVPAGCFRMGDASDPHIGDGGNQCFDTPFYISRYEITNAEFRHLGCTADQPSNWTGPQQPRDNLIWTEARDCAVHLEQQFGGGWRLPTEAEWEYAARGPDDLTYPWGNDWNPDALVWWNNANGYTLNVGSKPDGVSWVGADDLAGNVWEWTSSIYKAYPYDSHDGRENEDDTNQYHVLRGGSADDTQDFVRATYRGDSYPSRRYVDVGFRVVCRPTLP